MANPYLSAALHYASMGWHVFPLSEPIPGDDQSGKNPLPDCAPHGFHDATARRDIITQWWTRYPTAGIGVATAASKLCVVDVDVTGDKKGRESLASIQAELPDSLTAVSGSGGFHIYYQQPQDLAPFSKIDALPGLDIIGNGYIIAPPSPHYSGGTYRWQDLRQVAILPPAVIRLHTARQLSRVEQVGDPIVEGGRNNALYKLGAALRSTGLGSAALAAALHQENQARFLPPLAPGEVDHVVQSVMRYITPTRDVAASAVLVPPQPIPASAAAWLQDAAKNPPPPLEFLDTGCKELDDLTGGGFATAQMIGIMAPPSIGKSAYVGTLGLYMQRHRPVLHVTTELLRYEQTVRYAAAISGFAWRDAIKGEHATLISPSLSNTRIKVVGVDTLDRDHIVEQTSREADIIYSETGMQPIVIVDYMQILVRGSGEAARNNVGALSMRYRQLAQDRRTLVITVHSVSRAWYGGSKKLQQLREENDPTAYLSAAKESGDIEFDCATMLFLDVDQLFDGPVKPARAALCRCRYGSIGFVGYQVNLAQGLWTADPSASNQLTKEVRKETQRTAKTDSDDAIILQKINSHPTTAWRQLRDMCGIGSHRADAAKKRLLESEVVELAEVNTYDVNHRPMKIKFLRVKTK